MERAVGVPILDYVFDMTKECKEAKQVVSQSKQQTGFINYAAEEGCFYLKRFIAALIAIENFLDRLPTYIPELRNEIKDFHSNEKVHFCI